MTNNLAISCKICTKVSKLMKLLNDRFLLQMTLYKYGLLLSAMV